MGCEQSKDGQAWAHGNHGEIPNGKIEVGQEALERYIALENEIAKLEANSPRMVLEHKREQLKQITFNITDQEVVVESLNEAALGQPNNNEDGTKGQVLEMQQANNEPGVVEESAREAMAALNSQEIAETELSNMRDQKSNLEAEIVSLELDVEQLQSLYEEQETILDRIFGGAYGSEDENHLESSLDQHEQMRNRIVEANFKWRQAQLMVDYAYKQLEHAVTKWTDVQTIDPSNLEQRYAVASETRNNLVAASQNIQGAQRYLSNVQFPYCAPPEVETLNKATAYIFTDMQTPDRHEHAMECYTITSKRCGALLQWITQVVSQTISRDLDDINAKVKEASMKLRTERVRLIKEKVKEVMGKDVDIAVADVNTDVKVDLNLNDLAMTEGIDPNSLTLTAEELKALGLLLEEDLAPPPSQTEVFGEQMERLNQTYREDADRVQRQIEESRERMHQKLEQQLAVRRQRRARKNIEAKEREALIAS
ncbi:golgin subfamily A member 3-like isoform X3 [Tigriopus californicus]|uniref:golgin subfamily A member 3-like isoform X3 n=1 Tax=Tigriopus californicus TaxID=6832 RepID=UPI0027DA540C|nr:golgin subfamily A member 3-like isoform X3 [Tigriopus californicus]